jgi:hypothetical protein
VSAASDDARSELCARARRVPALAEIIGTAFSAQKRKTREKR